MYYWTTDQNNKSLVVYYSLLPPSPSQERKEGVALIYNDAKVYYTIKFKRYLYDDRD